MVVWKIPARFFPRVSKAARIGVTILRGSFHHVSRGNLCRRLLDLFRDCEAQRAVAVVLAAEESKQAGGARCGACLLGG